MIPKDPVILLSWLNTQLRDHYASLEALCADQGLEKRDVAAQMEAIDYRYDEGTNQFI